MTTSLPEGVSIIDSHCHLDYIERQGTPAHQTMRMAHAAGVAQVITIATTRKSWDDIKILIEDHVSVFGTVGIHPTHVAEERDESGGLPDVDTLVTWGRHPKIVALGETGVDCYRGSEHLLLQEEMTLIHIEAARLTGLPVVIHTRAADAQTGALLEQSMKTGSAFHGVIHCFSSDWNFARRMLDIGFYISCSAVCTYPKSDEVRQAIARVPMDRLLVETDAPFLAPQSRKGQPNTPAYMTETLATVASLHHVDVSTMAHATRANTLRLFSKMAMAQDSPSPQSFSQPSPSSLPQMNTVKKMKPELSSEASSGVSSHRAPQEREVKHAKPSIGRI